MNGYLLIHLLSHPLLPLLPSLLPVVIFRPFFNNPMGLYNRSLELGGVLSGMTFESERVVSFTDNRTLTDIIGLINDHLCSIIKAG